MGWSWETWYQNGKDELPSPGTSLTSGGAMVRSVSAAARGKPQVIEGRRMRKRRKVGAACQPFHYLGPTFQPKGKHGTVQARGKTGGHAHCPDEKRIQDHMWGTTGVSEWASLLGCRSEIATVVVSTNS